MKNLIFGLLLASYSQVSNAAISVKSKINQRQWMYVTAENLELKKGPGIKDSIIEILHKGDYFLKNRCYFDGEKDWYLTDKGWLCARCYLDYKENVSFEDPIAEHFNNSRICSQLAEHYSKQENENDSLKTVFLKKAEENHRKAKTALRKSKYYNSENKKAKANLLQIR